VVVVRALSSFPLEEQDVRPSAAIATTAGIIRSVLMW
jgi:hypothetical protein